MQLHGARARLYTTGTVLVGRPPATSWSKYSPVILCVQTANT